MNLSNKTAVVSGASRGIGRAVALALAKEGMRVALLARSRTELDAVAAEIAQAGGVARAWTVDCSDPTAVAAVVGEIQQAWGAPDLVVNNAGAGRFRFLHETPAQEIVEMMALPYFAAAYLTQAFLPAMLKRGSGVVVNVTSPAAFMPWAGGTGYAAARWAMRGLFEALRADLYGTGVQAVLLVPGKVASSYFEANPGSEERLPAISKAIPTLQPAAVAAALVRGLGAGKAVIFVPRRLAFAAWCLRLFPGTIRRVVR